MLGSVLDPGCPAIKETLHLSNGAHILHSAGNRANEERKLMITGGTMKRIIKVMEERLIEATLGRVDLLCALVMSRLAFIEMLLCSRHWAKCFYVS